MWFVNALIVLLCWGAADLFYKAGADENDRYSHLKTSIMVGLVMGIHAICVLIFTDISYDPTNLLIYFPVSAMYILSMTVGYFGLRYLEVSISSPIQNTSGAIVSLLCLIFLGQTMDVLSVIAVVLVTAGIVLLGYFEKKKEEAYELEYNKKYKIGFVAFFIPIIYCVIDALGTFFDAWYLDDVESTPLRGVTEDTLEDVANVSYEFTFLIVAFLLFIYVYVIKKQKFTLFKQKERLGAAVFETAGQFAYVYAMSGNGVVAAPIVASYSIVAVLLSRIFLKEKLTKKQYAAVVIVMAGIALMGLAEGLAEE